MVDWHIFPITGLKIIGENGFESPTWDDACICSLEYAREKFRKALSRSEEIGITSSIKATFSSPNVHSFICIKRRDFLFEKNKDKYKISLYGRLYQIFIPLQLAILFRDNTNWCTIDLYWNEKTFSLISPLIFSESANSYGVSGAYSDYSQVLYPPINLNMVDFDDLLKNSLIASITKYMLPAKKQLSGILLQKIETSLYYLSKSIGAGCFSEKLLLAIISLEVLLTIDKTHYVDLRVRIPMLIGKELSEELKINDILKARNDYVHSGKAVLSRQLSFNSIVVGIICLNQFLKYFKNFKDQKQFLEYLDICNTSQKFNELISIHNCSSFFNIVEHMSINPVFKIPDDKLII